MPRSRMFGSRTVPKVAKYAVVIYMFTRESKYDCLNNSAQAKARTLTKKMLQKLHDRLLKQPQYNISNTRGTPHNFTDWIAHVIKDKDNLDYFSVWMLEVNQCVHDIIHQWAQDYDPNDTESKKPDFFNEIFEELKT